MRLPNKIFSYNESSISKYPVVLTALQRSPLPIRELYEKTRRQWDGIGTFMEALDCLFALGKIKLDDNEEKLFYVD